jgi:glycerol uptake facilitator-like aquaporin
MFHKLVAEFVGSAFLVFVIFASGGNYLMIGGALALIVLLLGKLTGAAVNPAVAFALYYAGRLDQAELFGYVLVEMLGGYLGYVLWSRKSITF